MNKDFIKYGLVIGRLATVGLTYLQYKFRNLPSKTLQRSFLYVADEEKISNELQLFNAYNKNLSVTRRMPNTLKGYELIFLDGVTSVGMELEEIHEEYPNILFIYILYRPP